MKLQRVYKGDGVALGVLRDDDGKMFWTTFEDKPIPTGTYTVRWTSKEENPKHGPCWEVQNVPGRTDILIHPGNDENDSDGCILPGLGFNSDKRAISLSIIGYARLRKFLARMRVFTLVIADPTC